ncbi:MAG: TIGR03905 family TSCPD domain-containing protein [Victivallaceae bacterium]|nr:TIGR03905 family TSCPD domain-containing protein [Victivallaceae bacterium]
MVEEFNYKTHGTCSRNIVIKVDGDRIEEVRFVGGCPGNLLGIGRIVKGMTLSQVADTFRGVRCGGKATSCPDQLAKAIDEIAGRRG